VVVPTAGESREEAAVVPLRTPRL